MTQTEQLEKAIERSEGDEVFNTVTQNTVREIVTAKYDISVFVEKLGFALTSKSVESRVSGTRLLSAVLSQLPKDFLNETQLEFLATFYADRLKDQHNVIPPVIDGIVALTSMKHLPGMCVTKLLESFFHNTTCQSQMRGDRAKLFSIFKHVTKQYPKELKSMSGDFIYGIINSIDGERDPRNLDFIFTFMPDFIKHYPMLHLSEEMFEVFACYFPIDFNPSKSDPESITRNDLANKLTQCLVASPDFVEWTVALAVEKLESDLTVAKLDSLDLIHHAALKFAPKILAPYYDQIWTALKVEICPGSDNTDVVQTGLRALRSLLEQVATDEDLSHNLQTIILGHILPHLSEINQRLFNPSTAIALVCVAGDAKFSTVKILNTFLLVLQNNEPHEHVEVCIKIYSILAQIFKIATIRCNGHLEELNNSVCSDLQAHALRALRRPNSDNDATVNLTIDEDLQRAALNMLNECVPIISEANRVLLYKVLLQLITHSSSDLEFTYLLEQLGALYPIELQSNCIDVCIRNFALYSHFVKGKIYHNFLPLVKQMAFTQRVLDLIMTHVFDAAQDSTTDNNKIRFLALEALNSLLNREDNRFVEELQHNSCLIDKLIKLAQDQNVATIEDYRVLEQVAAALSAIVQNLAIAEQYAVVTEYLSQLNLQKASDLYIAKGLLGYLHKDISLDDHFGRLLDDLTTLSLNSTDEQLRDVGHHLLCSLVNKVDNNAGNRSIIASVINRLKEELKKENTHAVETLAWLAKGLTVRGDDKTADVVEALASLLANPSMGIAASLAFEIISAEYPNLHLPIVKFLFKQKFFHLILDKLSDGLTIYAEHHMDAFVYVLKTTPHAVLKMHIQKIAPLLFKGLEAPHIQTLCISLEICKKFIQQQDEFFRSHLKHIIPSCLQLSTYRYSMQVRLDALSLLDEITKYPTFVLLPHKLDVVLGLAKSLDDSKRLVRNAAVKARNSWYLVGTSEQA